MQARPMLNALLRTVPPKLAAGLCVLVPLFLLGVGVRLEPLSVLLAPLYVVVALASLLAFTRFRRDRFDNPALSAALALSAASVGAIAFSAAALGERVVCAYFLQPYVLFVRPPDGQCSGGEQALAYGTLALVLLGVFFGLNALLRYLVLPRVFAARRPRSATSAASALHVPVRGTLRPSFRWALAIATPLLVGLALVRAGDRAVMPVYLVIAASMVTAFFYSRLTYRVPARALFALGVASVIVGLDGLLAVVFGEWVLCRGLRALAIGGIQACGAAEVARVFPEQSSGLLLSDVLLPAFAGLFALSYVGAYVFPAVGERLAVVIASRARKAQASLQRLRQARHFVSICMGMLGFLTMSGLVLGTFSTWRTSWGGDEQSPALLRYLSRHGEVKVQARVARNIHTSPEALQHLSFSPHKAVVEYVALNPSTPLATLRRLATGGLWYAVVQNPSADASILEATLEVEQLAPFVETRSDLALLIAEHPNTTGLLLSRILTRFTFASTAEILDAMRALGSATSNDRSALSRLGQLEGRRLSIARVIAAHPNTRPEDLARLSLVEDETVLFGIATNPNAPLWVLSGIEARDSQLLRDALTTNPAALRSPETPRDGASAPQGFPADLFRHRAWLQGILRHQAQSGAPLVEALSLSGPGLHTSAVYISTDVHDGLRVDTYHAGIATIELQHAVVGLTEHADARQDDTVVRVRIGRQLVVESQNAHVVPTVRSPLGTAWTSDELSPLTHAPAPLMP